MTRYFDLSHPIENGMSVFPGDPVPRLIPVGDAVAPWRVAELHLGTHTGTHLDAAAHFAASGKTIEQYSVDRFCLPGVLTDVIGFQEDGPIGRASLDEALSLLPKGGGLFIRTDWDRFWGTEAYLQHPFLTAEAAVALVAAGAGLVGIDAPSVDSTVQATSHAHQILLGNDLLVAENLAHLHQLRPGVVYQFCLLPLLLPGLDGSPVRAVAWTP